MVFLRNQGDAIDAYAGPYERWVFADELGRPFSFPLIARDQSYLYTALMDGGDVPPSSAAMEVRTPPLWQPSEGARQVTPFVFRTVQRTRSRVSQDIDLARGLGGISEASRRLPIDNVQPDPPPLPVDLRPRFRVNFPVVPESWVRVYHTDAAPPDWAPPADVPKAIIAVIDDGLPFAHRAYLNTAGTKTRISYCWLQAAAAADDAHVPFGREFTNAEIDALRATYGPNEMALYRAAGAIGPRQSELGNTLKRHATHGAHVMGLAAGNDAMFTGPRLGDDIETIAVQLPNTIAWDTSGFGKEMYMLSAIHYVFERARQIADAYGVPELPLVLNFSYGWSAGRHDGQSEMEDAIQGLLSQRQALQAATDLQTGGSQHVKTALVMPTGNNFTSRMHARLDEARLAEGPVTLEWHVQPDDRTSSYFELWFPTGFDPTGYDVRIEPPHGVVLDDPGQLPVSADPALGREGDPRRYLELEWGGKIIGQMSADQNRGNRWRALIALIPTAYTRGEDRRAPSGAWRVTLSRSAAAGALDPGDDVLIWLQRDDDPSDLKSFGRQSYLVDPTAPKLGHPSGDLGAITGFGALNGVASSPATTRIGGRVAATGSPAPYSGAGGLGIGAGGGLEPRGAQTDAAAPSDQSPIQPGIQSLGVITGTRARLVGTSAAAPTVARQMVLNLAADRPAFAGFDDRADDLLGQADPETAQRRRARLGRRKGRSATRTA